MNVLSLFDGMSCGQLALDFNGIQVDNYFACEIDQHAIQIALKNFPDTIQLGNVLDISPAGLSVKIDLLLGGSPCQGFSFAGKQLNFDDPRSKLFFEYVRMLETCKALNPDVKFLLENVMMKTQSRDVITEFLGVEPICINSNLVSAQNRKRLYWTNIEGVTQPKDRGIYLEDILQSSQIPVIKSHGDLIYKPMKAQCLDANYAKGADNHGQRTGCIQVGEALINGHDFLKRVYSPKGKAPTLTAVCGGNQERKIAIDASHWRKLTPLECERLQGLPDSYTEGVSATQRYKMIGNGWQIDTIMHILSFL